MYVTTARNQRGECNDVMLMMLAAGELDLTTHTQNWSGIKIVTDTLDSVVLSFYCGVGLPSKEMKLVPLLHPYCIGHRT